jgi:apolipoprotein N-acyltransferase
MTAGAPAARRPAWPGLLLALVAGAVTVFAFAPFALPQLPVLTLGLLFAGWHHATPRQAAWLGFAFGLGLFGAGVSWVSIALHTFGGMPAVVAAVGTLGFCAYLALWPAFAGWLAARVTAPAGTARLVAAAGAWVLAEWLRGFVLSGFGWLSVGYAQLPGTAQSAFAGYAPVGGVFLVSLAMAAAAAAAAALLPVLAADGFASGPSRARRIAGPVALCAALAGAGVALAKVEWTHDEGAPLAVSLLQGNVEQTLKFDPGFRERTYALYLSLVAQSRGRLVVLPESAFPVFADEVPEPVLKALLRTMTARDGDAIVGLFTARPPLTPDGELQIHNSVVTLGAADVQDYRKRHLVPFGETIPLEALTGWFIRRVLAIPLSSQAPGPSDQPPLAVAGTRVAVNICYEDAFGADIRSQARDAAILVNVTNDAWYGRSVAAPQHNQIAAMRALETGRPLLRATNTGITSAIDHRGLERARLPWFTRGILEVDVVGRRGETPYVRFGDAVPAALAGVMVAAAALAGRRRRPDHP